MRNRRLVAATVALAAAGWWTASQTSATAAGQAGAPCLVNVPSAWGDYVGHADGYGFVFRDNEGTLRIARHLPCGLEGPPAAAVMIRRR
jgi:hypothetical protein